MRWPRAKQSAALGSSANGFPRRWVPPLQGGTLLRRSNPQGKQPRRLRAEAFLTGLTALTALTVLRADRVDTVNEVNNVRRQSSQHGQSSQPCPKPNAPAAGGWKKPGGSPRVFSSDSKKRALCLSNHALYFSFFHLFDFATPWEASSEMQFLANRNDS